MKRSFLTALFFIFTQSSALAEETKPIEISVTASPPGQYLPENCDSFEVFQRTVNYLKEQKELPFNMPQIFSAALQINKGCNGADRRFKRIFELLINSGADIRKSYELALDFAMMTDQKTDNFMVLFKGLFLENKFDLDFSTAFKISLQLSAGLPGKWQKVRNDFEGFLKFCTSVKNLDLPSLTCAEWALTLMKEEDKFPQGIFPSFDFLNSYMMSRKGPQMTVKDRLELISEVLKYGPTAPENFQKSLDWMNTLNGDSVDPAKAHKFALEIAKNSMFVENETKIEKALKK